MIFAVEPVSADLWTNKEVVIAVAKTVGLLIPIIAGGVGWFIKSLNNKYNEDREKLQKEMDRLKDSIANESSPGEGVMVTLQNQLKEFQEKLIIAHKQLTQQKSFIDQMRAAGKKLIAERDGLKTNVQGLAERNKALDEEYKKEVAKIEAEAEESEKKRQESIRVIEKATAKSGFTWSEKVMSNAPAFRPLSPVERNTPIISVVNLKGGVGKTTTTANLGATLARMGWKVLLIDLDLQGSLTSLFLGVSQTTKLDEEDKLVGNFLNAAFDGEAKGEGLMDYIVPSLTNEPSVTCDIVPTTDNLAYAENNLTVRWYLRDGNQDPRFLLRRELHTWKRVRKHYNIILIDCPPVLNVSCVNSLAASDYMLVPVMPSKQATDRAAPLVDRLKEFQNNVNPALQVLGFFANRTRAVEMSKDEKERMNELSKTLKDKGIDPRMFATSIRQSNEIRDSEDDGRPLKPDDDLSAAYRRLAQEVISQLPSFCRPETKN